jgi:hypothetical protein
MQPTLHLLTMIHVFAVRCGLRWKSCEHRVHIYQRSPCLAGSPAELRYGSLLLDCDYNTGATPCEPRLRCISPPSLSEPSPSRYYSAADNYNQAANNNGRPVPAARADHCPGRPVHAQLHRRNHGCAVQDLVSVGLPRHTRGPDMLSYCGRRNVDAHYTVSHLVHRCAGHIAWGGV